MENQTGMRSPLLSFAKEGADLRGGGRGAGSRAATGGAGGGEGAEVFC